jgi:diguanylate cyclase (GGDEF)-like protein
MMRETTYQAHGWIHPLTVLVLSPLAIHLGGLWHWTPGAASFALLLFPTCLAALSGQRATAWCAAGLATVSVWLEIPLDGDTSALDEIWLFPALVSGVLLGLAGVISATSETLLNRLATLNSQTTEYLRQVYERDRHETPDKTNPAVAASSESANFALLLLTLQDLGRRITGNLDLETLLPTIVQSAKSLLKCEDCSVFLWNPSTQTLKNPLPAYRRKPNAYVPQPQLGMTRRVLEQRHLLTRADVLQDYALCTIVEEEPELPDAIAPLNVGGEIVGVIVFEGLPPESPHFDKIVQFLTHVSALAIKNAQLFKRIEEMARRDGLTGLLNHASFEDRLRVVIDHAQQRAGTLSVIMSDIDHFKHFNDTHGHQAGDYVLQETSRIWQAVLPDYAVAARYGGEEFICVVSGDDLPRATELAEMLRHRIEEFPYSFEGTIFRVTASFGVAEWGPATHSPGDIVRLADEALYLAKQTGRNRVCQHPGTSKPLVTGSEKGD